MNLVIFHSFTQRLRVFIYCFSIFFMLPNSSYADLAFDNKTRFIMKKKRMPIIIQNLTENETLVLATLDQPNNISDNIPVTLNTPMIKLEPNSKKSIDILYKGFGLPLDRESFFILSIQEIPKKIENKNSIKFALNHKFKVFYRPNFIIKYNQSNALQWIKENKNSKIKIKNLSPYYITLSRIKDGNNKCNFMVEHMMISPFSDSELNLTCETNYINYSLVTDEGNYLPYQVNIKSNINVPFKSEY
ncbi:molecular chaperone [Acinetobacter soli]|uniref:fimbrial biogenesis chaperone n=3 Tax=Acinetobacter soli TaxID=487316 RepID=UPI002E1B2B0F